MNNRLNTESGLTRTLLAAFAILAFVPAITAAQVPVDENGAIIGEYSPQIDEPATGNEDIPLLSAVDLQELVGPIALYPDDLLAIVLPASAYPLQIVDAARFLEALEDDPSLKPDAEWDDSVVALLNYPEVVELLNDDIDWTWRLGEAVVSQQTDVVAAIETFRDRAYAAGNLKSDSYQNVSRDNGIIEIIPIAEDVIYVPYYEPERVVVYQPRPVYYYYPRPCPVYYYPYSSGYAFNRGYFWGVTTAFSIGWFSDSLNVFHHSYYGHPYYGHSYRNRWWYRRPTMNIHNTTYLGNNTTVTVNRYYGGDRWQPRANRRDFVADRRVTRNRQYANTRSEATTSLVPRVNQHRRTARNNTLVRERTREQARDTMALRERSQLTARNSREPVQFRERPVTRQQTARVTPRRTETATRTRTRTESTRQEPRERVHEQRQQRRSVAKEQRSSPTPKLRRSEAVAQARRATPTPRVRRAEPQHQARRAEPQRQERSARHSSEKSSNRAPKQSSNKSSERKTARNSERRAARKR